MLPTYQSHPADLEGIPEAATGVGGLAKVENRCLFFLIEKTSWKKPIFLVG